jgi:aminoglycoside phosphotransferase (APT) family kinase protein
MPHGYTNHTAGDGKTIIKAYRGPDAQHRCGHEAAVLSALAGLVPVPPVLCRSDDALRLGFMPGAHGQELLDAGLASQVLRACGRMLERIHAIDPEQLPGLVQIEGPGVLIHGDYGPNNLLLDDTADEVR